MTSPNHASALSVPTCDDRAIWDVWLSAYHFYTLTSADTLGVFPLLVERALDGGEIAAALGLRPRASEAMLGVLTSLGFLARHQGKYHLTPVTRHYLLPQSPYYWGPAMRLTQEIAISHGLIHDAIKENRAMTYQAESYDMSDGVTAVWKGPEMHPEQARFMASAMHAHSLPAAVGLAEQADFGRHQRLLDVGGGLGGFSVALARKNPALRCTVMELPVIAEAAQGHVREVGLAERVDVATVDMFQEPWPTGYDAVFFSDIFHDWDAERCRFLAERSFALLPSGGSIYLHEMLLDDGKDGPLPAASYSLVMLLTTQGKQFSAAELERLLTEVGFVDLKVQRTYGYFSLVSARKP